MRGSFKEMAAILRLLEGRAIPTTWLTVSTRSGPELLNKAGQRGGWFAGYGTATADGVLALRASGVPDGDHRIARGIAWLDTTSPVRPGCRDRRERGSAGVMGSRTALLLRRRDRARATSAARSTARAGGRRRLSQRQRPRQGGRSADTASRPAAVRATPLNRFSVARSVRLQPDRRRSRRAVLVRLKPDTTRELGKRSGSCCETHGENPLDPAGGLRRESGARTSVFSLCASFSRRSLCQGCGLP